MTYATVTYATNGFFRFVQTQLSLFFPCLNWTSVHAVWSLTDISCITRWIWGVYSISTNAMTTSHTEILTYILWIKTYEITDWVISCCKTMKMFAVNTYIFIEQHQVCTWNLCGNWSGLRYSDISRHSFKEKK